VDLFLDALDRIAPSLPAVVVGNAPTTTPLIERLRARDAVDRDFHWLGHIHDQELLSQLWSHCAVYFHGHSAGGTNPGLLQALGHGAPTIMLDTPFNAEVIDDPEQLVPNDADVVAARLHEVMEDPKRQRHYADHGRSVIGDRFTWAGVLEGYRDLLVSLADRPN
jgi:glycosyltransferase involved in cell wall biosynthesis